MGQNKWISVEAEIGEVQKALAGTSRNFTSIQKQALGILARNTVRTLRNAIKTGIKDKSRSTGGLQKAYGFRVKKDGSEANIYPRGASGGEIFPKAFVQNYGYEGPTVRAKNWSVKPKGFVQQAELKLQGNDYNSELNKMIDKVLAKEWGT